MKKWKKLKGAAGPEAGAGPGGTKRDKLSKRGSIQVVTGRSRSSLGCWNGTMYVIARTVTGMEWYGGWTTRCGFEPSKGERGRLETSRSLVAGSWTRLAEPSLVWSIHGPPWQRQISASVPQTEPPIMSTSAGFWGPGINGGPAPSPFCSPWHA